MEALIASSCHPKMIPTKFSRTQIGEPILNLPNQRPNSFLSSIHPNIAKFKLFPAISSTVSTEFINPSEPEDEIHNPEEKFDWFSQWYPIMPVCDLDKRAPLAKKVMGLDVVVWWDRNGSSWKVFDDCCPHRLAPLSEGRIDQWGRLQCVYHGWCFDSSGDCKFIPQAPPDGPPVHTFKKACVAVYPSTVQNDIVWFWPNTDPQYKDILLKKKPPFIPELDDPSYTKLMGNRDIPYGYEVLFENLMDPSHVSYAHYGIIQNAENRPTADREGGRPLEISVQRLDINGFLAKQEYIIGFLAHPEYGISKFIPPCVYYASPDLLGEQDNGYVSPVGSKKESSSASKQRALQVFICIPVSPGTSRLIWAFPRNFGAWIDRIVPRWILHVQENLILDSDLHLLHLLERKIMKAGPPNWQKACFLPTKSDALVVAFRKWLMKYSGGQVNWGAQYSGALPPTPPREQLMDRYWSHVMNCRSCSIAVKVLNTLEVMLQIISIASIGIVAASKQGLMSVAARTTVVSMAVLCFVASRWLSCFIHKNFHFHDYNHALR